MPTYRLSELPEAIRSFLADALKGDGFVVEDDSGHARGSFSPYRYPTAEQRQQANESLERIRKKTAASMKKHGVTEDDIMEELLKDD